MKLSTRHPLAAAFAAIALAGIASAPVFAADPPSTTKPAPSPDTKAAIVRFTLQLQRADDIAGVPVAPIIVPPAPIVVQKKTTNSTTTVVVPDAILAVPAPTAPAVPAILGSPVLTTFDNNTATLAISGGDLSYTVSLSPTIASDGKVLTLWNIRLSGKSLPGATTVAATGATRVETGKNVVIAAISLTDPVSGRRATFTLQGVIATGDAAAMAPAPIAPAPPAPVNAPAP